MKEQLARIERYLAQHRMRLVGCFAEREVNSTTALFDAVRTAQQYDASLLMDDPRDASAILGEASRWGVTVIAVREDGEVFTLVRHRRQE